MAVPALNEAKIFLGEVQTKLKHFCATARNLGYKKIGTAAC